MLRIKTLIVKRELHNTLPPDAARNGLQKQTVFSNWLKSRVMMQDDSLPAIMVVPMTTGDLTYRDEYSMEPIGISSTGWHSKLISSLAGLPQIVVPIGEFRFISKITCREAYLPIAISLIGAPGSESTLLDATRVAMKTMGTPTSVTVGKRCYEPSDSAR